MNGQYFCLEHCTDTQNVIKFERYDYDIFIFSKWFTNNTVQYHTKVFYSSLFTIS